MNELQNYIVPPYKVPLHSRGLYSWGSPDMPNRVWKATLVFDRFVRGRSAAHAVWTSDGKEYPMFLTHLDEVLWRCDILQAQVIGVWTVYKRGQNYGIGLAKLK
jgi:hypothetical protein